MAPGDAFAPLIRHTPKGPPPPADLTQPPDVFSAPQHGPTCRPQGFSGEAEEKNVAKFAKKWRAAGHIVAELKPKCSARLVIRCLERKRAYLAGGGGGVGPQGEGMRLAVDKPADALANRAHRSCQSGASKHSFIRGQEPKVFLRQGSFFPSHMLCRRTAFPAPGLFCPSQNPLRCRIQPDMGF